MSSSVIGEKDIYEAKAGGKNEKNVTIASTRHAWYKIRCRVSFTDRPILASANHFVTLFDKTLRSSEWKHTWGPKFVWSSSDCPVLSHVRDARVTYDVDHWHYDRMSEYGLGRSSLPLLTREHENRKHKIPFPATPCQALLICSPS